MILPKMALPYRVSQQIKQEKEHLETYISNKGLGAECQGGGQSGGFGIMAAGATFQQRLQ